MILILSQSKILIFLLFYLSPLVDSLTGFFILSGLLPEGAAGSPSQIYRLTLLLLMFLMLRENESYFLIISGFITYIISAELFFATFHQSTYGFIIGLIYGTKICFLLMAFMVLLHEVQNNRLSYLGLLKHVRNYGLITAILLIASFFLGYGFNTYGDGTFGFKGFFSAGNGLGVFLGVCLLLAIYYWSIARDRYSLFAIPIVLFATAIIGSKTALLFCAIGLLSLLISTKSYLLILFYLFAIIVIVSLFFSHLFDAFLMVYDVILFRFHNSDSISSWIFSNRENYFLDAIGEVSIAGFYLFRLLIGFGAYISFREPTKIYSSIDILESDFSDLTFMYGFLFVGAYLFILALGLCWAIRARNYFLLLIFTMLMGHSFMAGHVLFNGMSGVLVPIVFLLLFLARDGWKCRG